MVSIVIVIINKTRHSVSIDRPGSNAGGIASQYTSQQTTAREKWFSRRAPVRQRYAMTMTIHYNNDVRTSAVGCCCAPGHDGCAASRSIWRRIRNGRGTCSPPPQSRGNEEPRERERVPTAAYNSCRSRSRGPPRCLHCGKVVSQVLPAIKIRRLRCNTRARHDL